MARQRNSSRIRVMRGRGSFWIRFCDHARSPHGAQRNAGAALTLARIPDHASLHPELRAPQLPFRSWTSGKNISFHDFGASLIEPTLAIEVANFIRFSGVMVRP